LPLGGWKRIAQIQANAPQILQGVKPCAIKQQYRDGGVMASIAALAVNDKNIKDIFVTKTTPSNSMYKVDLYQSGEKQ
jgi:predicted patatin/cPLA2 family phospholipase